MTHGQKYIKLYRQEVRTDSCQEEILSP